MSAEAEEDAEIEVDGAEGMGCSCASTKPSLVRRGAVVVAIATARAADGAARTDINRYS